MNRKDADQILAKKRQRVLICIPSHDCKVSTSTCQSLVHSIAVASRAHAINLQFCNGNALIGSARSRLVAQAMHEGYDAIFFIDSDLGWNPDALVRLIDYPEEIVAGIYPYRTDEQNAAGEFPVKWKAKDGEPIIANEHGLLEVDGAPGGFMRIKRSAIEKLIAAFPETFVHDPQCVNGWCYRLFQESVRHGKARGEDYFFCDLWQQIGGQVWIDPNISFEHVGMKGWRGNLAHTLIRMAEDQNGETRISEAAE